MIGRTRSIRNARIWLLSEQRLHLSGPTDEFVAWKDNPQHRNGYVEPFIGDVAISTLTTGNYAGVPARIGHELTIRSQRIARASEEFDLVLLQDVDGRFSLFGTAVSSSSSLCSGEVTTDRFACYDDLELHGKMVITEAPLTPAPL